MKGSLTSDIPNKMIKEFGDLFKIFITVNFNPCLNSLNISVILEKSLGHSTVF